MPKPIKPGYKAINLVGGPAQDKLGQDLEGFFQYRESLSQHNQFWLKDAPESDRNAIMEIISQDLMEQDYSEVQIHGPKVSGNVKRGDYVAYHQNHGTAHGLRQREYQIQYLALIKKHGLPLYQQAANSLTAEEFEIMKLAAYMHRLGRTNEYDFKGDPLYGPRAMQIFVQIASELNFNPDLIHSVALTMNTFRSPEQIDLQDNGQGAEPHAQGFEDVPVGVARQKAILFERLIEMGHITDLVRCKPPKDAKKYHDHIAHCLKGMLGPHLNADEVADEFLALGGKLCETTGAPVYMLANSVERDPKKIVKAANMPLWAEKKLAEVATKYRRAQQKENILFFQEYQRHEKNPVALSKDIILQYQQVAPLLGVIPIHLGWGPTRRITYTDLYTIFGNNPPDDLRENLLLAVEMFNRGVEARAQIAAASGEEERDEYKNPAQERIDLQGVRVMEHMTYDKVPCIEISCPHEEQWWYLCQELNDPMIQIYEILDNEVGRGYWRIKLQSTLDNFVAVSRLCLHQRDGLNELCLNLAAHIEALKLNENKPSSFSFSFSLFKEYSFKEQEDAVEVFLSALAGKKAEQGLDHYAKILAGGRIGKLFDNFFKSNTFPCIGRTVKSVAEFLSYLEEGHQAVNIAAATYAPQ